MTDRVVPGSEGAGVVKSEGCLRNVCRRFAACSFGVGRIDCKLRNANCQSAKSEGTLLRILLEVCSLSGGFRANSFARKNSRRIQKGGGVADESSSPRRMNSGGGGEALSRGTQPTLWLSFRVQGGKLLRARFACRALREISASKRDEPARRGRLRACRLHGRCRTARTPE